MQETGGLHVTALYNAHKALNARLVEFAGFSMPVQYAGIIAEAKAVRTSCGMFDVSHMGRLNLTGKSVLGFLENLTTNDVSKLTPMSGQYSLLTNEKGGAVDDIILYRLEANYQMVVNASNHRKCVEWLKAHAPQDLEITDLTSHTSMIAVQGPNAVKILSELFRPTEALDSLPPFGVANVSMDGIPVQAARSGYTGEDGFELICAGDDAETIWNCLLQHGVTACGLGARDTLRVEAGLPLYGHELNDDLSPIAAGLGWVVSRAKHFVGSEEVNRVREEGPAQKLVGVKLNVKRLISPGMPVKVGEAEVGSVTSGVISPTFDTALALAFVDASIKLGTECTVQARGNPEPATIVSKRFYKRPISG
jgi:aminomethyltransferase